MVPTFYDCSTVPYIHSNFCPITNTIALPLLCKVIQVGNNFLESLINRSSKLFDHLWSSLRESYFFFDTLFLIKNFFDSLNFLFKS